MKFSEAVLLGSVMGPGNKGDIDSCAIGMAANAMGIKKTFEYELGRGFIERRVEIVRLWPWLEWSGNQWMREGGGAEIKKHVPFVLRINMCTTPWNWVAIAFNYAVCSGAVTLEQLVECIRQMEPECGVCNRTVCTCPKKALAPQQEIWEYA